MTSRHIGSTADRYRPRAITPYHVRVRKWIQYRAENDQIHGSLPQNPHTRLEYGVAALSPDLAECVSRPECENTVDADWPLALAVVFLSAHSLFH